MFRSFGRTLTALVIAATLGGLLVAAGPGSPANAAAADCEGGRNGFVDISDSLRGTHAPVAGNPLSLGFGVTVRLYYGTVAGLQRGWAMIDGETLAGDQVWMDWTTDGTNPRVTCGPFTITAFRQTKTSAAKVTSDAAKYRFRACGRLTITGTTGCTAWW